MGMPGVAKSELLKELYLEDLENNLKSVVLCFTNKAVHNLRQRGVPNCHTFDSWFYRAERKADAIMVDEFTTVPKRWFEKLSKIKCRKPDTAFRFFGDPDQCHALRLWYDYSQSKLLYRLSQGNQVVIPYKVETGRYDSTMGR